MSGLLGYVSYNPASTAAVTTTQQQSNNPTHSQLDATNLVVTFTTGPTGKILAVLGCFISASADSADNFLEWSLVDGSNNVVIPTVASDNGGIRVNLEFTGHHRAIMLLEYTLSAATSYTLYFGVANGNQVNGSGTATYTLKYGGGIGPATMEIWDLSPGPPRPAMVGQAVNRAGNY